MNDMATGAHKEVVAEHLMRRQVADFDKILLMTIQNTSAEMRAN